jgi:hypothetical protein
MRFLSGMVTVVASLTIFGAQAEECLEISHTRTAAEQTHCQSVSVPQRTVIEALCRDRVGAKSIEKTATCWSLHGEPQTFETCSLEKQKAPAASAGDVVCFEETLLGENEVADVRKAWDEGACYVEIAPAMTLDLSSCVKGKETKAGCAAAGGVSSVFFHDSKCSRKAEMKACWTGSSVGPGEKSNKCKLGKVAFVGGTEHCRVGKTNEASFFTDDHCRTPYLSLNLRGSTNLGEFAPQGPEPETSDSRKNRKLEKNDLPRGGGSGASEPPAKPKSSGRGN